MPDITYPNTISAGTTTSASDVAANLFVPKVTPDSLSVINELDHTNLANSPKVTREMLRPGSHFVGGTSGHTANRDYFRQAYPGGWTATTVSSASAAAVSVAGLCHSRYIPWTPSLFYVTWNFSVIIDHEEQFGAGEYSLWHPITAAVTGHDSSLHLYINGVEQSAANCYIASSPRTLAQYDEDINPGNAITSDAYRQDARYISGSWAVDSANASAFSGSNTPLQEGIHTVELRFASKYRIARFRTSNVSILAFR